MEQNPLGCEDQAQNQGGTQQVKAAPEWLEAEGQFRNRNGVGIR